MGIVKISYETSEDREQKLEANSDKRLIEEHNIFEGNFLVFDDQEQERYIKSLEDQILLMADQADGGIL